MIWMQLAFHWKEAPVFGRVHPTPRSRVWAERGGRRGCCCCRMLSLSGNAYRLRRVDGAPVKVGPGIVDLQAWAGELPALGRRGLCPAAGHIVLFLHLWHRVRLQLLIRSGLVWRQRCELVRVTVVQLRRGSLRLERNQRLLRLLMRRCHLPCLLDATCCHCATLIRLVVCSAEGGRATVVVGARSTTFHA